MASPLPPYFLVDDDPTYEATSPSSTETTNNKNTSGYLAGGSIDGFGLRKLQLCSVVNWRHPLSTIVELGIIVTDLPGYGTITVLVCPELVQNKIIHASWVLAQRLEYLAVLQSSDNLPTTRTPTISDPSESVASLHILEDHEERTTSAGSKSTQKLAGQKTTANQQSRRHEMYGVHDNLARIMPRQYLDRIPEGYNRLETRLFIASTCYVQDTERTLVKQDEELKMLQSINMRLNQQIGELQATNKNMAQMTETLRITDKTLEQKVEQLHTTSEDMKLRIHSLNYAAETNRITATEYRNKLIQSEACKRALAEKIMGLEAAAALKCFRKSHGIDMSGEEERSGEEQA